MDLVYRFLHNDPSYCKNIRLHIEPSEQLWWIVCSKLKEALGFNGKRTRDITCKKPRRRRKIDLGHLIAWHDTSRNKQHSEYTVESALHPTEYIANGSRLILKKVPTEQFQTYCKRALEVRHVTNIAAPFKNDVDAVAYAAHMANVQSNLIPTVQKELKQMQSVRRCYICKSEAHIDVYCPQKRTCGIPQKRYKTAALLDGSSVDIFKGKN